MTPSTLPSLEPGVRFIRSCEAHPPQRSKSPGLPCNSFAQANTIPPKEQTPRGPGAFQAKMGGRKNPARRPLPSARKKGPPKGVNLAGEEALRAGRSFAAAQECSHVRTRSPSKPSQGRIKRSKNNFPMPETPSSPQKCDFPDYLEPNLGQFAYTKNYTGGLSCPS